MDGHEHEQVIDLALDREIAAVLSVEPSPDFRTRVRARVEAEQATRGARWPWSLRWAGAAGAVMVAGVVVGWTSWNTPVAVDPLRLAVSTTVEAPPAPAARSEAPHVRAERSDARQTVLRESPVAPRRELASRREVMVSPDDAAALRHLVTAIGARQLVAGDIPPLGPPSAPLPDIEEIVLEPITLSPIAGLETE